MEGNDDRRKNETNKISPRQPITTAKMFRFLLLLVFSISLSFSSQSVEFLPSGVADKSQFVTTAHTTRLKEALMDGYDKSTPPAGVVISLQLSLQNFVEISTVSQYIEFVSWVRHYWKDERLSWDKTKFGNVSFVTFNEDEIWMGDNLIYETLEPTEVLTRKFDMSVYSDGSIFISKPLTAKVACAMDLTQFPFDTQRCKFTMGSWSFHGFQVDLQPRSIDGVDTPFGLGTYKPHNEFELLQVNTVHSVFYYACCVEPYPSLTYEFVLRRQSLTYIGGIMMPLILVTVAGFLTFILNPDSGERVGLGMTILLTDAAIYLVASELVPKIGKWTSISILYTVSSVGALVTLIISMLSVSLYCTKTSSQSRLTESELLKIYLDADEDGNGSLNNQELLGAINNLVLSDVEHARLQRILGEKNLDSIGSNISFEQWFDVVHALQQDDGLAAHHNFIVKTVLRPFILKEWNFRRRAIVQGAHKLMKKRKSTLKSSSNRSISDRMRSFVGREEGGEKGKVYVETGKEDVLEVEDLDFDAPPREKKLDPGNVGNVQTETSPQELSNDPQDNGVLRANDDTQLNHAISDPTEYIARKTAGTIDSFCFIFLPTIYFVFLLVLFSGVDFATEEFSETVINHTPLIET